MKDNKSTYSEDDLALINFCSARNIKIEDLMKIESLFTLPASRLITITSKVKFYIAKDKVSGEEISRLDNLCSFTKVKLNYIAEKLGITPQQLGNFKRQTCKVTYENIIKMSQIFNENEMAVIGNAKVKDIVNLVAHKSQKPFFQYNEDTGSYNPWHEVLQQYDKDFNYMLDDTAYFDVKGCPYNLNSNSEGD